MTRREQWIAICKLFKQARTELEVRKLIEQARTERAAPVCMKGEACECIGSRATLRAFCEHLNAERPENDLERRARDLWSKVPEADRRKCLDCLSRLFSEYDTNTVVRRWRGQRMRGVAYGSDDIRFHFAGGMTLRNMLRGALVDDKLPTVIQPDGTPGRTWDDYYYGAFADWIEGSHAGSHLG